MALCHLHATCQPGAVLILRFGSSAAALRRAELRGNAQSPAWESRRSCRGTSESRMAHRVQDRASMTQRVSLSFIAAILTVGALYVARALFIPLALALGLRA